MHCMSTKFIAFSFACHNPGPEQADERVQEMEVRSVCALQRQGETMVASSNESKGHLPPRVQIGAVEGMADMVQRCS